MQQEKKKVSVIQPTISVEKTITDKYRQKRVAAYCRVSTEQEEQVNSYAVQVKHYTELINREPRWSMVGIFADKGISGTSTKHRDEFNRMIRACKKGKIDMIITKSISRFARNTLDVLKYTRMLNDLNIDVYFEEQGIHTLDKGSEFFITMYGSIAQSESENISANVKWGKERSAKEGNVSFHYKNFLGYKRGKDGSPEIDDNEAEIVRFIYQRFLAGDSYRVIAKNLEENNMLTPTGNEKWNFGTIRSILTNERYKGDAVINKTYVVDCISKKIRSNNGERVKYYVENNHPAIIDAETFSRVQEEIARRNGKRKVKQVGTKTELGKYSCKYALTELLICGECGTPYRRCTWTAGGNKRIVWRCINRLDFGKKYCHHSPTLNEEKLHRAIMEGIRLVAMENTELFETLKKHIAMQLKAEFDQDEIMLMQIRKTEIDIEYSHLIEMISTDEEKNYSVMQCLTELLTEKKEIEEKLNLSSSQSKSNVTQTKIDDISKFSNILKNQPLIYSDECVRGLIQCIVAESKEEIKIVFKDGKEVNQPIN